LRNMEPGPTNARTAKPLWSWTGAAKLNFCGQESHLRDLIATLPARTSSDEQILKYLVDLRAHFQRYLHQDEFGPNRREQTAALRALTRSLRTLQRQLKKISPLTREQLDATLRGTDDPSTPALQAVYEAADDVESDLRVAKGSIQQVIWISRFRSCVETLMAQMELLDTNTDGALWLTALQQNFDLSQPRDLDFGLAEFESWLNNYWNVLSKTLNELNTRRGAEERVSLKLLVEQLCELWQRETDCRVTAHGIVNDEYTGKAETQAGRFITAAVEAMLPDPSWFEARDEFANSSRAKTFLPRWEQPRACQILVIMRDFVKRRSEAKGAAA
jgi:hypothetical protein